MRTLIITPMLPLKSKADIGGKYRRAKAFIRVLDRLSSAIELIYIVPEELLSLEHDQAALNRSQSEFWNAEVKVTLFARRSRRETLWTYYGAGIFDPAAQPRLHAYGGDELASAVGLRLDTNPDLVFVDRLDGAMPIIRSGRRPSMMLLDVDDVYHKVQLRHAFSRPLAKWKLASALQAPALLMEERRAVAAARLAFVCSVKDQDYLRRLGYGKQVRYVPSAVDLPDVTPGLVTKPTVLFLGTHYHPPNHEAAKRLAQRIWPLVRNQIPNARLLIAGPDSEKLQFRSQNLPGIEFLGFVDDLPGLYGMSRLVCCPIVNGGGTRLKLVEAAAFARPIVSTRIGAEGLEFKDGEDILLREDDPALAQACVALLRDDELCLRLGNAARSTMATRYDVTMIERQVEKLIVDVRRA
jgi:glycosyltransferase involved in cell wall biosynthesis